MTKRNQETRLPYRPYVKSSQIAPIHVDRWPWPDQVIYWTWRDSQAAFYASKRVSRNGKRLLLAAIALACSTIVGWVLI